jgi:hypothetical protein
MTEAANPDLWRFIRLEDYKRPSEPTQETMRRRFFGLRKLLGRKKPPGPVLVDKDLGQVPQELLDQVAPVPDWSQGMAAVTEAINAWLEMSQPENPVQVFVGPSYSGTPQILAHWAKLRGWDLVAAPEPEEILTGGNDWLKPLEEDNAAPLVLTHLEHCYLRHYDGLTLLRRLLESILSHRRRWLVGCGSWAWAFFRQVFKVDAMLPSPWILAPFDQERLQTWLPLVDEQAEPAGFVFRQSDSGKYILPPPAEASEAQTSELRPAPPGLSNFLTYLAAHSRGIPGIAWAVWRHSLYVAMEQESEGENDAARQGEVIWVKPWSQIQRPLVPNLPEKSQLLMVLHALMLHGGLWDRVMAEVLPIAPMEIIEYLYLLQTAGLVESDQGFWRVTPQGYPAVRQSLQSEEYLVDAI